MLLQLSKETEKLLRPIFINLSKSIEKINNIDLDYISELFKIIQDTSINIDNDVKYLSNHGWFLDLFVEVDFPRKMVLLYESGEHYEADQLILNHYSSKIESIEQTLIKRHPNRSDIIKQIFYAHKNEKFFISIPSIYSQIDGICLDFTKKQFFKKNRETWKPEFLDEIENINKSIYDFILAPLEINTPINSHESNLKDFPIRLNRHEIMHGIDIDYGTKLNSFKSISLLYYVSDFLSIKIK